MKKKINVLYYYDLDGFNSWSKIFLKKAPDINLVHKDNTFSDEVDVALVWLPPRGLLASYKNLKGNLWFLQLILMESKFQSYLM